MRGDDAWSLDHSFLDLLLLQLPLSVWTFDLDTKLLFHRLASVTLAQATDMWKLLALLLCLVLVAVWSKEESSSSSSALLVSVGDHVPPQIPIFDSGQYI
ncbi:hypothetical protein PoB_000201300 [Plakobranchus ocellatus]|uniref:Uncharacterized protein n=1 Tax=Plakobranchus ocellatus TaxID=259542 RepID=A0AAV3XZ75_9GAST|nr:hypothetical protein PoB_000201300 [Plakobranchus ocellatus]